MKIFGASIYRTEAFCCLRRQTRKVEKFRNGTRCYVLVEVVFSTTHHYVDSTSVTQDIRRIYCDDFCVLGAAASRKNTKESVWGQPDGLCRKEKWPWRHVSERKLLRAILNWDSLTTVENCQRKNSFIRPANAVFVRSNFGLIS